MANDLQRESEAWEAAAIEDWLKSEAELHPHMLVNSGDHIHQPNKFGFCISCNRQVIA